METAIIIIQTVIFQKILRLIRGPFLIRIKHENDKITFT